MRAIIICIKIKKIKILQLVLTNSIDNSIRYYYREYFLNIFDIVVKNNNRKYHESG